MRFLLIAICASLPLGAAGQQLHFKGLQLGSSKEELLLRHPTLTCSKVPPQFVASLGEETCSPKFCSSSEAGCAEDRKTFSTYGGAPTWEQTFYLVGSRVEGFSVTIHPGSYESVREALKEIYGKGREEIRTMVRSNGSRFESRVWWSSEGPSHMMASEHGARLNEATVQAVSETFSQWRSAAKRGDPKKNKGDL